MSSQPTPTPASGTPSRKISHRVTWPERFAFGAGGMPLSFGQVGVKSLAIPVYQMTLQVNPTLFGLVLALPQLWDAITDPLMGHISDHTRSRFGRRRPFIIAGAVLMTLAYIMIWQVPVHWSEPGLLGWLLATSIIFYTCNTIWSVPYQSLGYELTPDYHERTTVMGMQNLFTKTATLTNQWLFPLAQLSIFVSAMQGVRWVTIGAAVVVFLTLGLLPGLFVKERFVAKTETLARTGFWKNISFVGRSRGMIVLMSLVIVNSLAGFLVSGLDYYVLVYYVCDGDIAQGSVWKAVLSSGYAVVGFVAIAGVTYVSRRFDKRNALMTIYGLVVLGGIGKWFFFHAGMPWLSVFDPVLCAPIFVATGMLAQSMLADLCDEDELKTGERHEGMYGAVYSWVGKMAISMSFFIGGMTLDIIGFDAKLGADQDPGALLAMRLVLVFATSIPAIISILILRLYPLDAVKAAGIRAALEERRGAV